MERKKAEHEECPEGRESVTFDYNWADSLTEIKKREKGIENDVKDLLNPFKH